MASESFRDAITERSSQSAMSMTWGMVARSSAAHGDAIRGYLADCGHLLSSSEVAEWRRILAHNATVDEAVRALCRAELAHLLDCDAGTGSG